MTAENIYKGPEPQEEQKNQAQNPGYTVVEQSIGFNVPEAQLIETVTTGLSGCGQVREVNAKTVYKGGTIG
jgi:hypothetical protein